MQLPQQKSLQYAVYGEPQGNNTLTKGFDVILMDLVKIMLFMEPRAYNMYMQSNLCDQFVAQANTHNTSALSAGHFPAPTGTMNTTVNNGPPMGYVEMWKWSNMSQ